MSYINADFRTTTWTPTVLGSTTNPTVTYTHQRGTYFKLGRMVFVFGRIQINTISGGSGNAVIGGFPFAPSTSESERCIIPIGWARNFTSSTTPYHLWMNVDGTSTANVYRKASTDARDASNTSVTVAEMVTTSDIVFSGFYISAS